MATGLIGWLIGGKVGIFFGCLLGCLYVVLAAAAADRWGIDCYTGSLSDGERMPDLAQMVNKLSKIADIAPPAIYILELAEPNLLVCGCHTKGAQSRIGITQGLITYLETDELFAVIAWAVCRISSGESVPACHGASLAGMPLVVAMSPALNFEAGPIKRDPQYGQNIFGKAMYAVCAPVSYASLFLTDINTATKSTDMAAAVMMGGTHMLSEAMIKVARVMPQSNHWSLKLYNPATAPLFFVSPYENLQVKSLGKLLLSTQMRTWLAGVCPTVDERIAAMQALTLPSDLKKRSFSDVDQEEAYDIGTGM